MRTQINSLYVVLIIICFVSCQCRGNRTKSFSSDKVAEVGNNIFKDTLLHADRLFVGDEIVGNYKVNYSIGANEIVADTLYLSDTEYEIFYNHSLFLTVCYNNRPILSDYEIRSTSFDGIENPEKFQLSPMGGITFDSVNDTLHVSTGMFVVDTDWGYFLTIKVSKTGKVSLYAEEDDTFGEEDIE